MYLGLYKNKFSFNFFNCYIYKFYNVGLKCKFYNYYNIGNLYITHWFYIYYNNFDDSKPPHLKVYHNLIVLPLLAISKFYAETLYMKTSHISMCEIL